MATSKRASAKVTRSKLTLTRTRAPATRPRGTTSGKRPALGAAATSAPTGLTEVQIRTILRFHLRNLGTSGQAVTDDSVFQDDLSDLAVAGMSSRVLFKAVSRRDIVRNGGQDKTWPANWLQLTPKTLAPKLV